VQVESGFGRKRARIEMMAILQELQRRRSHIAFVVDDVKLIQESGISYDQILVLENPLYGYEDKLSGMMLAPYEHTLFLDADTYVVRPIPELFQLLDRFDIAAKHNSRRRAAFLEDVPDSFPEYNTGVVAYHVGDAPMLQPGVKAVDQGRPPGSFLKSRKSSYRFTGSGRNGTKWRCVFGSRKTVTP